MPKMSHVEHSSCKAFQTADLDKKQKCNGCEVLSNVSLWKCACNDFWHKRPTHRGEGCRPQVASVKAVNKGRTLENPDAQDRCKKPRAEGPITYEQLLEEDQCRVKRKRTEDDEWLAKPGIELGIPRIKSIRVASLGPGLKRKFIHSGGI